jgi:hypothetical protein
MKLAKNERIVTAFAERASGPGWSNQPLWVIVRDGDQNLRMECLQPSEQSGEICLLYNTSEATHCAMVAAVERCVRRLKREPA